MRIRHIAHASVIIETSSIRIWTDPWLSGKVYDGGWGLLPDAVLEEEWLQDLEYLWISNLREDCFHLPSLGALGEEFKKRVTVLLPTPILDEAVTMLRPLGFEKYLGVAHLESMQLSKDVAITCFRSEDRSFCLGINDEGNVLWGLNQSAPSKDSVAQMRVKFGPPSVLLQHFSVTGYEGLANFEEELPKLKRRILRNMVKVHLEFGAKQTIPYANFFYFSCESNRYMNAFKSSVQEVYKVFDERGLSAAILFPGSIWDQAKAHDSSDALAHHSTARRRMNVLSYQSVQSLSLSEVHDAFCEMQKKMENEKAWFFSWLPLTLVVWVTDLKRTLIFDLRNGKMLESGDSKNVDLYLNSSGLVTLFSRLDGIEYLQAAGRLRLASSTYRFLMFHWLKGGIEAKQENRSNSFYAYLQKELAGVKAKIMSRVLGQSR